MLRTRAVLVPLAMLAMVFAACATPLPPRVATTGAPVSAPPEALAAPLIELGAPDRAVVAGESVAFDGVAEGLYWPALAHAFAQKGAGIGHVVMSAPRNARTLDVLRAVWTLREVDVEVQTLGPGNEVRPLVLARRPATGPDGPTCHAAVFVSPEGKLRVALPGGPSPVRDVDELVASIAHGARSCHIRWLAVGGETTRMAWGWVFDVAYTIQASHAGGNARVVLGEALGSK